MNKTSILVIDDEEDIRTILGMQLKKAGYKVDTAANGEEGLKSLIARGHDMLICDVRMPVMGGMELLDEISQRGIDTTVLVMSAFGNKEVAIQAIKRGAYDYFNKPFTKDEVLLTVYKAEERLRLKRENAAMRGIDMNESNSFQGMIGSSDIMKTVFRTVAKVAPSRSTILVQGESGTGKELAARAIHNLSPRADQPFVAINCGAIPEALIESELFGHKKGAFTDASSDKIGLFEEADGGTLFLDEIAELPLNTQVKLLRAIQESEIRRLGETRPLKVDVRLVAASLHNLEARVKEGLFREDLFYRLNVISVELPPLRQRITDLDLLIEHFIKVQNARQGAQIKGITPAALEQMHRYAWPGNVRELQNCVERGVVLSVGDQIDVDMLPDRIRESNDELKQLFNSSELSIKKMGAMLERILIKRALEKTCGNRSRAAKLLEISHRALLYKIKDYSLETVGLE